MPRVQTPYGFDHYRRTQRGITMKHIEECLKCHMLALVVYAYPHGSGCGFEQYCESCGKNKAEWEEICEDCPWFDEDRGICGFEQGA